MNVSRVALLSLLLGYSTSLHAVPVVWDFVIKDVASQTYTGSFGYESNQPGRLIPFMGEDIPGPMWLGRIEYDVDFFQMKNNLGMQWEFRDGVTIQITNDAPSRGVGIVDGIALFSEPVGEGMLLVIQTGAGGGGGNTNPMLSSDLLPTDSADFNYFDPFFDDPPIGGIPRIRDVSSPLIADAVTLESIEIHRVPEPAFRTFFGMFALLLVKEL